MLLTSRKTQLANQRTSFFISSSTKFGYTSGHLRGIFFHHGKSDHQNRADSHFYPLGNRSVIEHQTLQGLRTTVNLSQMDAAPLVLADVLGF
jgi:hypothetical protein